MLKYRLETPENLNPSSVVWHYNTQSGGRTEYFTLTVSDQGFTSSTDEERVVQARPQRPKGPSPPRSFSSIPPSPLSTRPAQPPTLLLLLNPGRNYDGANIGRG